MNEERFSEIICEDSKILNLMKKLQKIGIGFHTTPVYFSHSDDKDDNSYYINDSGGDVIGYITFDEFDKL